MNARRYLLTAAGVFVVYSVLAYVIHEIILGSDYAAIQSSLRSVEQFTRRLPVLYAGNLIFALAFCFIYAKGYEPGRSWLGQGTRFGLILGTLLAPVALTEYVVYPIPEMLAVKWVVFGYLQLVVSALVAAALYQPRSRTV